MAKGRNEHQQRLEEIECFGKDLARRAKRLCELCEDKSSLTIVDTAPDAEPSLDSLILLCRRCQGLSHHVDGDPRTLRFLESVVWSESPVIAKVARHMVRQVNSDWARACVELLSDIE